MQKIDKSKDDTLAKKLIDGFLNQSKTVSGEYVNVGYNQFRNVKDSNGEKYIQTFEQILRQNQNNYCCYCMRCIDSESVTLEHIIPQKTKSNADFDAYINFNLPFLNSNNVVFKKNFNKTSVPPYPHDISYDNLVVSCDGTFWNNTSRSCNHKREDNFIYPLFYDANVMSKIKYEKDGRALPIYNNSTSKNEQEGLFFLCTCINCEELREIRKIWFQFSQTKYDISHIQKLSTEPEYGCFLNKVLVCDDKDRIRDTYRKPRYWDKLMKYSWFLEYFRTTP